MTTLYTKQAVPVPGQSVEVVFQISDFANFLRVWVTDAPDGSGYKGQLASDFDNRIEVYQGVGGQDEPWRFVPDVGGKYVLAAQQYTRGTDHGGSYAGDPDSFSELTPLESEETLSVVVAQRVTQPMGVGEHRAELVCYVLDDDIVETSSAVHGETTPSIVPITDTVQVRNAVRDSDVITELAGLVGPVATAVGNLEAFVINFISEFNAHLTESGVHENDDDQNAIDASFRLIIGVGDVLTEVGLVTSVNACLAAYRRHILNDDASGNGTGSDDHHIKSGSKVSDYSNATLFQGVGDMATAIGGLADLYRCYNLHEDSTTPHLIAGDNAMDPPSPLVQLHAAFLAVIASSETTGDATVNPGVAELVHGAGFAEKAL